MKKLETDVDMLDFAEDFINWVKDNYDINFGPVGDSEHCMITFALSEIINDYAVKREE